MDICCKIADFEPPKARTRHILVRVHASQYSLNRRNRCTTQILGILQKNSTVNQLVPSYYLFWHPVIAKYGIKTSVCSILNSSSTDIFIFCNNWLSEYNKRVPTGRPAIEFVLFPHNWNFMRYSTVEFLVPSCYVSICTTCAQKTPL